MNKKTSSKVVDVSIVVPIYNEEGNIDLLLGRLLKTMDGLDKSYEVIFVNDGSKDKSMAVLTKAYKAHPDKIRVVDFQRNFGQHKAVMAGFEESSGKAVVTLDADLQNPPEEIPKLLDLIDKGYDCVGGYRLDRQDSFFRRYASRLVNKLRARVTNIHMTDEGCMLRAYNRELVDIMLSAQGAAVFIPALAYSYASKPTEVAVEHAARHSGESKYHLFDLVRLSFDIMAGYSLLPLQIFTLFGFGISILSFLFFIFLLLRRIFVGPEVEGVFTLFAILFFLIGILLMGLGITGEYIGRIYQEVRRRPKYVIKKILGE
jgi:undecaprenyl-phosphate 4-deoxy-4-formamido-L-arabinose transferase